VFLTSRKAKTAIHIPVLYLSVALSIATACGLRFVKKATVTDVVPLSIAVAFLLFVLALVRVAYVRGDRLHVRGAFVRKSLAIDMSVFAVRTQPGSRSIIHEVYASAGACDVWFGEALSESHGHRSARRLNRIFRGP
jgi:hypothetical protein